VHDGDLAGRPAEADESKLQPESEGLGKGGVVVRRGVVVVNCNGIILERLMD